MKRLCMTFIPILTMASHAGAIEIYQGKTLTPLKQSAPIAVEKSATVPVDRSKEIKVYKAGEIEANPAPNNRLGTPTAGATDRKDSKSVVKFVENSAKISAHGEVCGVSDPAIREKLLNYLASRNVSAKDNARFAEIYDAQKLSAVEKMKRASGKGADPCEPSKMEKLVTSQRKLLAILDNTAQREKPAASASGVTPPQTNTGGQAKVFTKEELAEMHKNDVKAGRTSASMSDDHKDAKPAKGNKSPATAPKSYNPDPYNTGGWNYNTNQSASPIWNPYQ